LLDSAFMKYEQYDNLDNFSRMFGKNADLVKEAYARHKEVNIIFVIADFLSELVKNLVNSQYRVNDLTITNSKLLFNDYSLLQKFSATTDSIVITARDIDSRKKRSYFTLQSRLLPFGNVNANLDANPNDFGDFHLEYAVSNVAFPMFNPYLVTYTSFPFNKGEIQSNGTWNVVNKQINSANHLRIINPTTADKIKKRGTKHVPVPLLLAFVRDWRRMIDIDVPITGNLDDPNYHLWNVILNVIENIFVKPPTFPYTITKHKAEKEKEEHEMMEWKPMQTQMSNDQEKQLKEISHFLKSNPQVHLTITPYFYEDQEKEIIVLYEAKKKYYGSSHQLNATKLSEDDSMAITNMSIKDSAFVNYLNHHADTIGIEFSVLGKCMKLIGQSKVDEKYNEMVASRKKNVMAFFADAKQANRVTYKHEVSIIPRSGFSHDNFQYQ